MCIQSMCKLYDTLSLYTWFKKLKKTLKVMIIEEFNASSVDNEIAMLFGLFLQRM